MGFEAYLRNDAGKLNAPTNQSDWRGWVSASKTRNWCRKDPLLDWINPFGVEKGHEVDPAPDPRTDFQEFVFRKGREFEEVVIAHVATVEPVFYEPSGVQVASH